MKFLFNATPFALIAMLASGCGYDYTCKGLEENHKKLEDLKKKESMSKVDKAEAKAFKAEGLDFAKHMMSYYESWPTSGKTLECTLDSGKKEQMIFSQEVKDQNLKIFKDMKKQFEGMTITPPK